MEPTSTETFLNLLCGLGYEERHFLERPLPLTCGHSACQLCFLNLKNNTGLHEAHCRLCNKLNSLDIDCTQESVFAQGLIDLNITNIGKSLKRNFEDNFIKLKSKIISFKEYADIQVQFAKEEIEIRAESLHIQIDELKASLMDKFDNIKIDYEEKLKNANEVRLQRFLEEFKKTIEFNQINIIRFQDHLRELKRSFFYLDNLNNKVSFEVGANYLSEKLFGRVNYQSQDLTSCLKSDNHEIINLEIEPFDLCPGTKGKLFVSSQNSNLISVLDEDFKTLKSAETDSKPRYLATNDQDSVYITLSNDRILKTDFDLKFVKGFGAHGSGNLNLNSPSGIAYFNNSVYICDSDNYRIQKLSEDLEYQESYPLNYKPWKIKILKNIACIRSSSGDYNSFYNLNPFYFKTKLCRGNGDILAHNAWFHEYKNSRKTLRCYDMIGNLVDEKMIFIDGFQALICQEYVITYFNEKFIIGLTKEKKLISFSLTN